MRENRRGLCICCQPLGSGGELTELAEAAGFVTLDLPLVALRPNEPGVAELSSFLAQTRQSKLGVIFSSKMAFRTAHTSLKDHTAEIFAVGSKTAKALEDVGLRAALIGDSDLNSLYRKIIDRGGDQLELVHVCGELSAELSGVRRFVVYSTVDRTPDSNELGILKGALSQYEDVYWLFTNGRSAERMQELVDAGAIPQPRGIGVAIGESTARAVRRLGFEECRVAVTPGAVGMVEVLARP